MRIVLDTNVLVSAILSQGSSSARIIRLVLEDVLTLAVSRDLLDEAYRVIRYPKLMNLMKKHDVSPEEVDALIGRLSTIAVTTPGELALDVIRDDPSDNKVLACAVESGADCIISGDRHLVGLTEFRGIAIVNPSAFLSMLLHEEPPA